MINKQSKNFPPLPIILGAVCVLVIVFLGAFTFSFVKSKVTSQSSNSGVNLEKASGGKLGNLPSGSTVKTKEEGIAVCKASGVDYCWSAVAASFNDLGVCKQSLDVKTCEADAKELMQAGESQKGQGGNTNSGTVGTGNVNDQTAQLKACQKGTFYQTAQGKMTVVGKENVTIDGSKYEICCWETTSNQFEDKTVQAVKSCMVTDQGAGSMVIFVKKDNRYVLQGATLMKNGQKCSYSFDVSGAFEDKLCQ